MRISGITLPDNKRMEIALMSVYGIGRSLARRILIDAHVDFGKHANKIEIKDEQAIRRIIETLKVEGDLKREISSNIKRLKDIKSYRGARHSRMLPSRGQRTKSNSRTRRGNVRKTMGSGRKKLEKK